MASAHHLLVLAAALLAPVAAPCAPSPGHVTGIGGIFIRSKDPKALMAWYRDMLGVPVEAWGGALLRYDAPGHPPVLALNALRPSSDYIAPSQRDFMLDFAVDDLDAVLARLKAGGVPVLKRDDSDPQGRFAWVLDPDGTKIELWQPRAGK